MMPLTQRVASATTASRDMQTDAGDRVMIQLADGVAPGLFFANGRRYYADRRNPVIEAAADDAAALVSKGAFGYVKGEEGMQNAEVRMLNAETQPAEAGGGTSQPTPLAEITPGMAEEAATAPKPGRAKKSKEGEGNGA